MQTTSHITHGLIVRKRWLDLILSGRKTWEMRSRNTTRTGPIALVEKGTGTVVGVAWLTGCSARLDAAGMRAATNRHGIPEGEIADVMGRNWTVPWHLADARRLRAPIRYEHRGGAVTWVMLNPAAQAALRAQVGEAT